MEYRTLDTLGIKASLLGYGCMRFPRHRDGKINYAKAEPLIDLAYSNGVTYFDTAYNYHNGESEEFTGKALSKYDRSTYYLATKLPFWLINSYDEAVKIFHSQLERLNKDYIDFYLLHSMNREGFDKMVSLGILELLDKLKAEGKIRYIGFSFHDGYEAFEYILKYRQWDFCQIQLNYMDTDNQAGIKGYELAEQLHIPVIIMEPVKGGNLAKLPSAAEKHFKAIHPEKSAASWALRYVASLGNVKVVLSGMSDVKQVTDNLNTFQDFQELNDMEQQAVVKVTDLLKKRIKNGCTGCRYCMPCPSGVDIPGNFELWNEYGIYRRSQVAKWWWTKGIDEKSKAMNCTDCGNCEAVCPQKLPIREDLKKLQTELDRL